MEGREWHPPIFLFIIIIIFFLNKKIIIIILLLLLLLEGVEVEGGRWKERKGVHKFSRRVYLNR